MAERFLVAEQISHRYQEGRFILRDINLAIAQRSFISFVGLSGIGKSTLLKILGGLIAPSQGSVSLDGRSPYQSDHPIGIVFQNNSLMPWRTVVENVRLPLEIQNLPPSEAKARVMALLDLVGLTDAADQYPAQLSGGMAQRVALARGLVHQPDLLLLDEPFGALDALTRERMGEELLRIWQALPVTVVLVTHSIREAVYLSDRVLVLNTNGGGARGPATVTADFSVALSRPRMPEMQSSSEFLDCVADVRAGIGST